MDFDFEALLCDCVKKCTDATGTGQTTNRRSQFIAEGVLKSSHAKLRDRRISKMSVYDSERNLPKTQTDKVYYTRNQRLEKWKEEKKQKLAAASLKNEVFRTGTVSRCLSFVSLPQSPNASTSGRDPRTPGRLRSYGRVPKSPGRHSRSPARNTTNAKQTPAQSFAPINAKFKPPQINSMVKLPTLAPPPKLRPVLSKQPSSKPTTSEAGTQTNVFLNFDPVITKQPTTREAGTQTIQPSNTYGKPLIETHSVSGEMAKTTLKTDSDILPKPIEIRVPKSSRNAPKRQVAIDQSSSEEMSENYWSSRVPIISITSSSGQISTYSSSSIEKPLNYSRNGKENVQGSPIINASITRQVTRSESGSEEKPTSPHLVESRSLSLEQIADLKNCPFVTVTRGSKIYVKEKKRRMIMEDGASKAKNNN